jgi:hypothetical protein
LPTHRIQSAPHTHHEPHPFRRSRQLHPTHAAWRLPALWRIAPLPSLIFASRWLQLPLYLGLIAAQGVYVWHFLLELWHLVEAVFGNQEALHALITNIGYKSDVQITHLNETIIMLVVLALIDVVMISNLLIMVIVGATKPLSAAWAWSPIPTSPSG